jgi:phage terminase small subunit
MVTLKYSDFLKYKDSSETIETEQEESIPDLIEGLKVLAESLEGAEKKEIEDVIEGLEILLESDDKYTQSSVKTEDLITFRILKPDGKIKFAGTGEDSWFKLDKARKLVDYSKGEMIYEYNTEGRRISEWFEKGGEFRMKKGGNIVFKPITTPL